MPAWHECRFLTCSVLPVRQACNLHCPFCFSQSSISALRFDAAPWQSLDVERYYDFARERGATRLVITGGGEPLLRPDDVVALVRRGRRYFDEIACFTNGSRLTAELSQRLQDAGLSYFCYSRHHHDDERCRQIMGRDAPRLADFVAAAGALPIRATCVMTRGAIDSPAAVDDYMDALSPLGIRQFTFKHTYIAYGDSLFASSRANAWSREHHVDFDPFAGRGEVLARLPWGPCIRRLGSRQVCYYFEPTPAWELEHRLCRSINLLSDGTIYASLEDQRSRLFQLAR
jgi:cyclic pyranopterin phosphate synthase